MVITNKQFRGVRTIWAWRVAASKENVDKTANRQKQSLREAAYLLSIGLAIILLFGATWLGATVICISVIVLVTGCFFPSFYDWSKKLVGLVARVGSLGLTWLLLAPFFYICFTGGRCLLLIIQKDPLHQNFSEDEQSYWTVRQNVSEPEHYRKQY